MRNNSQYAGFTSHVAIKKILIKHNLLDNIVNEKLEVLFLAMEESFREGWLRGEEYESTVDRLGV